MFEAYRMIYVNLIIYSLLLFSLFVYKYVFPKKNMPYLVLLLLFAILPVISIFRFGDYESGDFNIHVYRSIAFYHAIQDGQIIPSWPENLNATYGYPLFIILNHLPYNLISVLIALGSGFINSLKLYLAIVYIASGVFFWLFAKKIFQNGFAAFVGSIFYLFAPYHLLDLHFRAAVGELLGFVMLPILFLTLRAFSKKQKLRNGLQISLVMGLFLLSHQAISVFALIIAIPYAFFVFLRNPKQQLSSFVIKLTGAIAFGFLLGGYAWIPHLTHAKFTYGHMLAKNAVIFPALWELFYSPYRYGLLFQGPQGELSFAIGYTQWLVVFFAFFLLVKQHLFNRTSKLRLISYVRNLAFWFVSFCVLFFLMTPISAPLWESIPILSTAQFSTRLLVLVTFVVSMIGGYLTLFLKTKKVLVFLLVIVTVGYTMLNWGHRRVIPEITDETLEKQLPLSSIGGEGFYGLGSPKWIDFSKPWFAEVPSEHLQVLEGEANIVAQKRTSIYHTYIVNAITQAYLKENTLFFPGWNIRINGITTTINVENPSFPGVMTFSLQPGLHFVEVIYQDLPFHTMIKIISVSGFTLTLLYVYAVPFTRAHLKRYKQK